MPTSTARKLNTSRFDLYFAPKAAAVILTLPGGPMMALLFGWFCIFDGLIFLSFYCLFYSGEPDFNRN